MANRQNTLLIKRSNVPYKVPPLSGLTLGELALNTADAKLYTLFTSGSTGATEVREIGWNRISRTGDTVNGNFNFFGDVQISGSSQPGGYALSVTGDTNLNGDLYVQGDLFYNGSVIITGGTVIQSGLTANTIYTDYIDFNTGATVTQSPGRIYWDSGTGTLNVTVGDGGTGLIDLQVGQEEIVRVYNSEATTLLKGEIVYVSGSQGNRPAVKRAQAQADLYSVTTLGMVDRNISSGAEGYVTTFGIISNLNTLGLTGGTPVWLSPTVPGGYTSTKPQAPEHIVLIGYVVRVSATVGSIFINISNGWELDELHDVRISAATEGDLLVRSTYSGSPVWVNTKTLNGNYNINGSLSATTIGASGNCVTDLYVSNIHSCSPLNINPLDEGNVYFGSTSGVTVDVINSRLGIGTSNPTLPLQIVNPNSSLNYEPNPIDGVGPNLFVSGNSLTSRLRVVTSGLTGNDSIGEISIRSWNDTTNQTRGSLGDVGLRSGTYSNGLNIYKAPSPSSIYSDYIRFYAGALPVSANTPDIHIQGSGSTRGYVGIGTTSPTQKLHISGNAGTVVYEGTNHVFQQYYPQGISNGRFGYIGYAASGSTDLRIQSEKPGGLLYLGTEGNITMTFSGSNVGVNIAPTAKFHINNTSSFNSFLVEDSTNPDSSPFVIDNEGRVGIGTPSPSYKLQVNGTYGSMSYDPNRVRVSGNTNAGTFDSELLLSGTTSGLTIINLVNGINSLGLISIGDDSGSTIFGNGGDTSIFNSSAARNLNIINSNGFGNDNIRFYAGQTASGTTPDIHIQGSGSTRGFVGIGTDSPNYRLDVNGDIAIRGDQSPDDARIHFQASDNTNRFTIETDLNGPNTLIDLLGFRSFNSDDILVLKGDGTVGVGTSVPTEKLYVSGNTVVSGSLSGGTMVITTEPTSGYTTTQILMRNSTTGQVEITDSTSPSIYNYGMTYAMTTFNYLT